MTIQKKTPEQRILELEYHRETTERHLKEVREVGKQTATDVSDIKNAIIGNQMNGDFGLVHQVKRIEDKQSNQENILIAHKVYFKQIGVVVGGIVLAVIGLAVAFLKSKI